MLERLATRVVNGASWVRVGLLLLAYIGCVSVLNIADARIKQLSSGLGKWLCFGVTLPAAALALALALALTAIRGKPDTAS